MENEEQNERELDLFVLLEDFFKIGKRYWALLLVLVVVCSAGLTMYRRMKYQPKYEAYASFTVRVANPLQASAPGFNSKTAEVMAATFPSIITSGVLQEQVMEDLDVGYLPAISVSATGEAGIITISVRDGNPQFAYNVLNSVIDHYPNIARFVLGPTVLELLDESGLPTQPMNAFNAKYNMVRGGIIGALLWCVVIACITLLKNTVHNEEELENVLNLSCLGQVPNVKITKRQPCPLIFARDCNSGFAESIRLLRIRVDKVMEQSNKKVLLVSSAISGEGKTTISVNLAASLARKGKRVLLIDCDLRNPSVCKVLQLDNNNNMYDFMQGKATVKDMLKRTKEENLCVISGGKGLENGAVVALDRERTMRLITAAKKVFDYVILNTPPCSMLADAAEIANLAECGLMVVRQDFAAKEQIMDGIQHLSDGNLQLIGSVFNSIQKSLASGYGYGYG